MTNGEEKNKGKTSLASTRHLQERDKSRKRKYRWSVARPEDGTHYIKRNSALISLNLNMLYLRVRKR